MHSRRLVPLLLLAGLFGLASCSKPEPQATPAQIRAQVSRLLPVTLHDRAGWAQDSITWRKQPMRCTAH